MMTLMLNHIIFNLSSITTKYWVVAEKVSFFKILYCSSCLQKWQKWAEADLIILALLLITTHNDVLNIVLRSYQSCASPWLYSDRLSIRIKHVCFILQYFPTSHYLCIRHQHDREVSIPYLFSFLHFRLIPSPSASSVLAFANSENPNLNSSSPDNDVSDNEHGDPDEPDQPTSAWRIRRVFLYYWRYTRA